jgi:hypothetical protein
LLVAAILYGARCADLDVRMTYRSEPRPTIIKMPAIVATIDVAGRSVSGEKYAKMKSEIGKGLTPLHEKEDEPIANWRRVSSHDPGAS